MATKKVNESAVALAKREYARMVEDELQDVDRDEDGFIILKHTATMIDQQSNALTSSIESLEDKLRRYKEEKSQYDKMKKSPEYQDEISGKKKKKKKTKKARQNLLEQVFNNADELRASIVEEMDSEEAEDEDNYRDSPKAKRAASKAAKKTTTLDTTYGTRYAPIISTYYDLVGEFDDVIDTIKTELTTRQGQAKGMYRSSQTGNLVSAMNAKFSVAKQIQAVADKVTDIEYRKAKDQKADESDSTRAITLLGAQYLRGSYKGNIGPAKKAKSDGSSSKSKKDKDKEKHHKEKKKIRDEDDDDEFISSVSSSGGSKSDREQAAEFAKILLNHRSDIKLSPHEYHIDMEGKYKFIVVADSKTPEDSWEFVAVDPKTDKKIKGFKENYRDLYPKKKLCRMRFDLEKMRAVDKNSNKSYALLLR